jgi:hypothetical protein
MCEELRLEAEPSFACISVGRCFIFGSLYMLPSAPSLTGLDDLFLGSAARAAPPDVRPQPRAPVCARLAGSARLGLVIAC